MSTRFDYAGPSQRCKVGETELHCGDCFQLFDDNGKKHDVRIEYSQGDWYLVGVTKTRPADWDGCLSQLSR